MTYDVSGGGVEPGWYLEKEGAKRGEIQWVRGPGTAANVRDELRKQLGPDERGIRKVLNRGLDDHIDTACEQYMANKSPARLEALTNASVRADETRYALGLKERETLEIRPDKHGRSDAHAPKGVTVKTGNGRLHIQAERAIDIVVKLHGDAPDTTVRLDSEHPGNVTVNGDVAGSVTRAGDGAGDAIRDGDGEGTAERIGEGAGSAIRAGCGDGDALRLDDGPGNAVRRGEGYGIALRGGTGIGDAHVERNSRGDGAVKRDETGNARISVRDTSHSRLLGYEQIGNDPAKTKPRAQIGHHAAPPGAAPERAAQSTDDRNGPAQAR